MPEIKPDRITCTIIEQKKRKTMISIDWCETSKERSKEKERSNTRQRQLRVIER